jgi:hypothetical protein
VQPRPEISATAALTLTQNSYSNLQRLPLLDMGGVMDRICMEERVNTLQEAISVAETRAVLPQSAM